MTDGIGALAARYLGKPEMSPGASRKYGPARRLPPRSIELEALGEAVLTIREQANMSQELVAKEANTDITQIGGIERGLRNPSYESLTRIAKGLDTTVGEIATLADRYRSQWEREEREA